MASAAARCSMADDAEVGNPAVLPFESHATAAEALGQLRFAGVDVNATYASEELATVASELLSEFKVIDSTSTIPTSSDAAYQSLLVAGVQLGCLARKNETTAFMLVKTEDNTPSFLFSADWCHRQLNGQDASLRYTPGVYIFVGERQIVLPVELLKLPLAVAAKVVADEIDGGDRFCCGICGSKLLTRTIDDVSIGHLAVSTTGDVYKADCVMSRGVEL